MSARADALVRAAVAPGLAVALAAALLGPVGAATAVPLVPGVPQTLGSATCAAPPTPSPNSIYTLPAWSDMTGWDEPAAYGTIQTADFTGDGADEVLGRGPDGVAIAQLGQPYGVFSTLPPGPALTDAIGWNEPQYGLTVHAGDIDGDGEAEIVALDGTAQVVTFDGDAATGTWTQLPGSSTPGWASGGTNWAEATHYESFGLVDLDGDGNDELVARAAGGIIAADFVPGATPGTGAWQALPAGPPLSDANGWNTPFNSGTIRYGNLDGQPGVELLAMNGTPAFVVYSFSPTTNTWTSLGSQLPAWNAGATAWSQPQYYSTVALANINGDAAGIDEVVARSANGLVAASWNAASASWTVLPTSGVLADSGGFNQPQYYESMRYGDITGDGADDVFISGPGTLQVVQYRPGSTSAPWVVSASAPLVPTAWAGPSNYGAFTLGNVNGGKALEVIGRDQYGVRTFRFSGGGLVFAEASYPVFTRTQCQAYQAVMAANSAVLQGQDLRAAYANPGIAVNQLKVPTKRPSRISVSTWHTVTAQLSKEIAAAQYVRQWHVGTNGMAFVIQQGFTPQVGSIGNVTQYFVPKPSTSVAADILPFLEGMVEGVGLAVGPEGSIGAEEVATAINSVLGFAGNYLTSTGYTTFELNETQDGLQGQVARMQQAAIDGNTTNEALIPLEYGLMMTLQSVPLPAANAPWQGMWQQSDIFFWQTFANTFWSSSYCLGDVDVGLFESVSCIDLATTKVDLLFTQPVNPWVRSVANDEAYWVGESRSNSKPPTFYAKPPSKSLPAGYQVLFGTPTPQCTPPFSNQTAYTNACALGIQPEPFYLGQDGWSLPLHQVTHIG